MSDGVPLFFGLAEPALRLGAFGAIFATMALLELLLPATRHHRQPARGWRWFTNLGLMVASTLTLRLVFPLSAVGIALMAETENVGLFPALGLPPLLAGILGFLILDLSIYAEHVAAHRVPLLWRLHRVHHADEALDLTTAVRFHPGEILLSMLAKSLVILAFGIPPLAVLLLEIALNGAALFNHANLALPPRLERWLAWLIVTPALHRMHHSTEPQETDSNYGFNLSIWDRLFRTFTAPRPAEAVDIGLSFVRDGQSASLRFSLLLPLSRLQKRPQGK